MPTERVDIVVTGRGFERLGRQFGGLNKQVTASSRRAAGFTRSMTTAVRGSQRAVAGLRGLGLALGGVGLAAAAKEALSYQEALARLRLDAKLTADEFSAVERAVAAAGEVGIVNTDALAALRVFQDFGGNLRDGVDQLVDLSKFARSTGTDLQALAQISGTMISNMKLAGKEGAAAWALMKEQGDLANISLATSAQQVPRVMAAARKAGWSGLEGVRQAFGGFQLMAGQFGSGPEAAARGATQFEALISGLVRESSKLKKRRINVFDERGAIRGLPELVGEIFDRVGSSAKELGKVFREKELLDAVLAFRGDQGRLRASVPGIFGAKASATAIQDQFDEFKRLAPAAQESAQAMAQLSTELMRFGGIVAQGAVGLIQATREIRDEFVKDAFFMTKQVRSFLGITTGTRHGNRLQELQGLAQTLAGAQARGRATIAVGDGRGGQRQVPLTPETAMRVLEQNAKRFEVSAGEFAKMRPILQGILDAVKRPQVVSASGLERPEIKRGRGGSR